MANQNQVNKFISARNCMDDILIDLGLSTISKETNNQRMWFTWIWNALVELRLPSVFSDYMAELNILNCQAQKPDGYVFLQELVLVDASGNKFVPRFSPLKKKFANEGFFENFNNLNGFNPSIVDGFQNQTYVYEDVFSFNVSSGCDNYTMQIAYRGFAFDEQGYPIVDRMYYLAIMSFCKWKYICRSRFQGNKQFTAGDEQQAELSWVKYAARNRSQSILDGVTEDNINQLFAQYYDRNVKNNNPYMVAENNNSSYHNSGGLNIRTMGNYGYSYSGNHL